MMHSMTFDIIPDNCPQWSPLAAECDSYKIANCLEGLEERAFHAAGVYQVVPRLAVVDFEYICRTLWMMDYGYYSESLRTIRSADLMDKVSLHSACLSAIGDIPLAELVAQFSVTGSTPNHHQRWVEKLYALCAECGVTPPPHDHRCASCRRELGPEHNIEDEGDLCQDCFRDMRDLPRTIKRRRA